MEVFCRRARRVVAAMGNCSFAIERKDFAHKVLAWSRVMSSFPPPMTACRNWVDAIFEVLDRGRKNWAELGRAHKSWAEHGRERMKNLSSTAGREARKDSSHSPHS